MNELGLFIDRPVIAGPKPKFKRDDYIQPDTISGGNCDGCNLCRKSYALRMGYKPCPRSLQFNISIDDVNSIYEATKKLPRERKPKNKNK